MTTHAVATEQGAVFAAFEGPGGRAWLTRTPAGVVGRIAPADGGEVAVFTDLRMWQAAVEAGEITTPVDPSPDDNPAPDDGPQLSGHTTTSSFLDSFQRRWLARFTVDEAEAPAGARCPKGQGSQARRSREPADRHTATPGAPT